VRFLRRRRRAEDTLDITPLVDVVFLLNIFFLLTSSYFLYSGIKINVPRGAGDASGAPDVVVAVTRAGEAYLGNDPRPLPDNELNRRLKSQRSEKEDLAVLIRGDRDARFGRLIEVYSVCKAAGVTNLRVETKPVVGPPAPGTPDGRTPDRRRSR
jgi:biopolymer transport protein ExbD